MSMKAVSAAPIECLVGPDAARILNQCNGEGEIEIEPFICVWVQGSPHATRIKAGDWCRCVSGCFVDGSWRYAFIGEAFRVVIDTTIGDLAAALRDCSA